MAGIDKVTSTGVSNWLGHNNRLFKNDRNKDIDPMRTHENECLTPYISEELKRYYYDPLVREKIKKEEFLHYKKLKDKFFCFNRKDVNTLVSVVVTLPKEIQDSETEKLFFQGTCNFLCERYGNTVSVTVHRDEGKHYVKKDSAGNPVLDDSGNHVFEWHEGRNHLHYTFIPTVKIDKDKLQKCKNPIKSMFDYAEKISAKERIDRKELLSLHPDLNTYINDVCKIRCNLHSGITKEQGGNKSVRELKQEFDQKLINHLTMENERLYKDVSLLKDQLREAKREKDLIIEAKDKEIAQLKSARGLTIDNKDNSGWKRSSSWSKDINIMED